MTRRLAVLAATYDYLSHAQQITDRFLTGYPRDGRWHRPETQVVSMYVDAQAPKELSGRRAAECGFRMYSSITETLRCGGDKLAVDGVLMFGEFFRPCVDVFETDGRSVPVYKGKHLADSFEKANLMVESARRLGFPVLAGSALPLTWRLPDLELHQGCVVEEALMAGAGLDALDALEALQAMLERRRGGESGVRAVRMMEGGGVWKAAPDGLGSMQLLSAALSRSDTPQGWTLKDGRTQDLAGSGEVARLAAKPAAYLVEHRDGLRATLLMLDGAVKDFTFAARVKGLGIQSTQLLLTPPPQLTHTTRLAAKIEEMFETHRAPYAVDRDLLVCGVYESCLASRLRGSMLLETPHLALHY